MRHGFCPWVRKIPWSWAWQPTPVFLGCSRQEYWSQLLFPPPGDLPDPGIEPMSHALASCAWEACVNSKLRLERSS